MTIKWLILQHIDIEDPGYIKQLMQDDGSEWVTVELDQGERIPRHLDEFDAMLCMGGPMDTWMEVEYPWLIEEKKRIREFVVEKKKPFIGFCLGAQLLGEALGGKIVRSKQSEIGVLDIQMHPICSEDHLLASFPPCIKAVQWHSYEVQGLNHQTDVCVLASSPVTEYQMFRYQQHAYGIQFHIEVKKETIAQWANVPAYRQALVDTLGENALEAFDQQAKHHMHEMNQYCHQLYYQFKQLVFNLKKKSDVDRA